MYLGVVADDITGSDDMGSMFSRWGMTANIYTYQRGGDYARLSQGHPPPDIVILDTNSRLDPRETAYDKVRAATRDLLAAGCTRFHNKTCSVFRGNIGAEFDAMLDELVAAGYAEFAVVVLGFPRTGRFTRDGIHTVRGQRLEDSEFRRDPIHPMTRSDLVGILQAQTWRRVGLVTHEVVSRGADALRQALADARGQVNYAIVDVIDQPALATIAAAVANESMLCGSSGLGEELPRAWGVAKTSLSIPDVPPSGGVGVLCVAGSLMPQTSAQIARLRAAGVPAFELDTAHLFSEGDRAGEARRLGQGAAEALGSGQDALIASPQQADAVRHARDEGARRGLSAVEVGRLISGLLAEASAQALAQTGSNRLVVAGGETSAAVCERLGMRAMQVAAEIEPGLPACVSLEAPRRVVVLKSGSFGSPQFLLKAIEHVKGAVVPK